MKMSSKVYDILKYTALIGLPALGTLYGTLAGIWGLPFGDEVVKTVMAVDLCLGSLLGISSHQYKKQQVNE